jgi:hypothetical protein
MFISFHFRAKFSSEPRNSIGKIEIIRVAEVSDDLLVSACLWLVACLHAQHLRNEPINLTQTFEITSIMTKSDYFFVILLRNRLFLIKLDAFRV